MMQGRALLRSITWRRASLSKVERFQSTVSVEGKVDTESNEFPRPGREKIHEFIKDDRIKPQPRTRWKLLDKAPAYYKSIEPGTMSRFDWGQAKKIVLEAARTEKPQVSSDLLNRLIEESRLNPDKLQLYGTLFNVTIQAWAYRGHAEEAEGIFSQMVHLHSEVPHFFPKPDKYSYNALLKAWAASNSPIATSRVEEILREMEESKDTHPDAFTYNIVMAAYANRVGEYGAAKAAEDILLRFSERHVNGLLENGPDTLSFNIAMKAWGNSGDEKGPHRAMEIYTLMEKLHAEGHEQMKPDSVSLLALMNAFSPDVEKVEHIFRNSNIDGDLRNCYNCLITMYSKARRPDSGLKAEQILQEMVNADEITYQCVLNAYASSDRPDAAPLCEDFLGRTVEKYLKYESNVRPDRAMFHTVLRAWKHHADKKEAIDRSIALLTDMDQLAKEWKLQTVPNVKSYSFLLSLLADTDVKQADKVLQKMEEAKLVAHDKDYDLVVEKMLREPRRSSIESAFVLLDRMERNGTAHTATYARIIRAVSSIRDDPDFCKQTSLDILNRIETLVAQGNTKVKPNIQIYTCVLIGISRNLTGEDLLFACEIFNRMLKLHNDSQSLSKLGVVGCRTMLFILSRVRSVFAADRANEILEMMLREPDALPDSGCLSSVILANARAPNVNYTILAHERLLKMFKFYCEGKLTVLPHRMVFSEVLYAWSKSNHVDKVKYAYELLEFIKQLHEKGIFDEGPTPRDYQMFFEVLSSCKNKENSDVAEKILDGIENPDILLWNSVLNVWARARCHDKVAQTARCLRKMIETNGAPRPTSRSYNAVLYAAGHARYDTTDQRKESLKIASNVFDEMKVSDDARPDDFSYGAMMGCYRLLMEPSEERKALILELFQSAKDNGLVGPVVIRELQTLLVPQQFKETLGDAAEAFLKKQTLPESWTKSITKSLRKRKH